MQYIASAAY